MLCVYALTSPARSRVGIKGIAGEPLREVTVNGIAAVVGELSRVPRPTEARLRTHGRIIAALTRRSAAVLPARFGSTVRDVGELSSVLGARQRSFRESLALVRNRTQMTIRLIVDDIPLPVVQVPVGQTLSGLPLTGAVRSGAEYLRSLAAEARHVPGFDPLRRAVRRWIRDERVERHGKVMTVYHLIPRSSAAAYRTALDRAAAAAGIRLVVTGPWPPYAFATSI